MNHRASTSWLWILSSIACAGMASASFGCASAGTDDDAGGSGGTRGTTTTQSTTSTSGTTTTSATSTGTSGPVTPSWNVTADFKVNDFEIGEAVRSATAVHQIFEGVDSVGVVLTDVEDYCDARKEEACGAGPHFGLQIGFAGITEPGTYDLTDGRISGVVGDVADFCGVGGFGAESGSVTIHEIELGPNGHVALDFDFTFFTGHAEGTVVAPLCVIDP